MVPAWSHKPNHAGSIPAPATIFWGRSLIGKALPCHGRSRGFKLPSIPPFSQVEMKLLSDGTIERDPDGHVYLEQGDKVPFSCPGCKSLFPFSAADVIICPKCGERGDTEHFSEIGFQYMPPN